MRPRIIYIEDRTPTILADYRAVRADVVQYREVPTGDRESMSAASDQRVCCRSS